MKQVLQNLKTGELEVAEVVVPKVKRGHLLIKTSCSLISPGTERMLVNFAKSGLIGKAKQQPDRVRQVLEKMKTDGIVSTLNAVFSRLDEPLPLGYCNSGRVVEIGDGVEGFEIGDRVVSNGPHAEYVCVPKNLCARIPDNVSDEEAAFTPIASIALQGVRLIKPELGETIVVYGLGVVGFIASQILLSAGCKVIGIDIDKNKLALAKSYGVEVIDPADGPIEIVSSITKARGADAVLIAASAKNDTIVHESAQMLRKRGRIILVGVVNLDLRRDDFYKKEISFQVSCSYGPGRYDVDYEEKGYDYPYGFVRWTSQRNFEAVLGLISSGKLNVGCLIADRLHISDAPAAYNKLTTGSVQGAIVLSYPGEEEVPQSVSVIEFSPDKRRTTAAHTVTVGLIGAGNFARVTLLPILKSTGVRLKTVADIDSVAGAYAAKKFGFERVANDYRMILEDKDINAVYITTRHDLHSQIVIESLKAGKNVHVEKPLCLNRKQLAEVKDVYEQVSDKQLLVGFNRRFSPHARKIRSLISSRREPLCMVWLVNAGYIPKDVWVHDRNIGGGRIIGEGCHWLDFMRYVTGCRITSVSAAMIGSTQAGDVRDDKISITINFADGSIGTLHYFANGHKSYPKETFKLFCEGKILYLDNFRRLYGYGWKNFRKMSLWTQDKGHRTEVEQFINLVKEGGEPLILFEEIENVTLASFAALESAESGCVVYI